MNQIAKQSVTIGVIALEVALLVAALTALEAMSPPPASAFESMADHASGGFAPETLKVSRTLTTYAYLPYITTPISGTPKDVRVYPEAIDKYGPRVAHHDGLVYAAWYGPPDYGFGNSTVSIASSTNSGLTWRQSVTTTGTAPAIAVDVYGHLHMAYLAHSGASDTIVYYTRSIDDGRTLTPPLALKTCTGNDCSQPDIALDADGNAYVVWDEGTDVVLGRVINQAGGSISITETVVGTTTVGYAEPPRVAVSPSGRNLYVIWKCPPDYGSYVRTYFARSTDGGDAFEPRYNPTGFTHHGEYAPDVAAFGEEIVYITWVLDQYLDRRANFARSENSGASFSSRIELGQSGSDYDSTIAADTLGQICVAWRQGNSMQVRDLYFRCSLDRGQDFLPAKLLASGPPGTGQYSPALALWRGADSTYMDAVWQDERNGYADIFFSSLPVTP